MILLNGGQHLTIQRVCPTGRNTVTNNTRVRAECIFGRTG